MRVGSRNHRGEGPGDKGEESSQDNEALRGSFPRAIDDGQLPVRRTLLTRMVALMVGPSDPSVILHMEEDRSERVAPRPMKMGTIASPWRYDAAIRHALKLPSLRCSATQHYTLWIPRYCRVVRLPLHSGHLEQPVG
jgi:hypothetical protein